MISTEQKNRKQKQKESNRHKNKYFNIKGNNREDLQEV